MLSETVLSGIVFFEIVPVIGITERRFHKAQIMAFAAPRIHDSHGLRGTGPRVVIVRSAAASHLRRNGKQFQHIGDKRFRDMLIDSRFEYSRSVFEEVLIVEVTATRG